MTQFIFINDTKRVKKGLIRAILCLRNRLFIDFMSDLRGGKYNGKNQIERDEFHIPL